MSNTTINDLAGVGVNPNYSAMDAQQDFVPQQETSRLKEILTAETGEGSIEMYIEHPLNFNNSKGVARVLRGLTGIMGNLNYAIVDIVIGSLDVLKSSSKGMKSDVNNSGVGGTTQVS